VQPPAGKDDRLEAGPDSAKLVDKRSHLIRDGSIVIQPDMTARRIDDEPRAGYGGRDVPCGSGGAEAIVFD
jgi:hypothetical protein